VYYSLKSFKLIKEGYKVDVQTIEYMKKYIDKIGIFSIKLIQWLNNRFKLISDDKNLHSFLEHFEMYFENCPKHNIEFTKKIFFQDFGINLEDIYDISSEPIASGSIGQVYKGIDKQNKREIAIKCVHPDISKQIFIPKYILIIFNACCSQFKFLHKYKMPIDLYGFFDFLEGQIDLRQEAKNMKIMRFNYINNDIIVIPEPLMSTKNIIVMSYEKGDFFENLNISDYKKSKIVIPLKIFLRSSLLCENFVHGDLHDGNWKVREHPKKKKMYKIIINDLGICIPVNNIFINNFIKYFDAKNIDKMVECIIEDGVYYMPDKYKKNKINLKNEMIDKINNGCDLNRIDTNEIMKLLIPIMTKSGIILKNIFLNLLVVIMLTQDHIRKYSETTTSYTGEENQKIRENNLFKVQYPSMISFCQTYNCFPKCHKMMLTVLEENENDIELFDGVEDKLNFFDSGNSFEKIDLDEVTSSEDDSSSSSDDE